MTDIGMTFDTKIIISIYRLGNKLNKKKRNLFIIPLYLFLKFIYRFIEVIYGFSVPFSAQIGKNICFKHGFYGVFISSKAIIGDNVIIMHQVTIGSNFNSYKDIAAPVVGNNVFIGPGAKVIGNVLIEDNCKIGANALIVNQNCEQGIYVSPKAKKI